MFENVKNKFKILLYTSFLGIMAPTTVFACPDGEVSVGGLNLLFFKIGDRCYPKPTYVKPSVSPSAGGNNNPSVNCSNNYGGLSITSKGITINQKCVSSQSFNERTNNIALAMVEVRTTIWWVCIILAVICLIIGAIQLGISRGNPQAKQKAWGRIKISLIAIACIGGISTIATWAFALFA